MPGEAARQVDALLRRERAEQRRRGEQVLEQALAREAVERFGELRQLAGRGAQRVGAHLEQVRLADDLHRRGARLRSDEGELAEDGAFAEARQLRLLAEGVGGEDTHAAGGDEEEAGARLAFAHDRSAVRQAEHAHRRQDARERRRMQLRQQRHRWELLGELGEARRRRSRLGGGGRGGGRDPARRRASAAAPPTSGRAAPGGRRAEPRRAGAVELRQRLVQRDHVGAERVQRLRRDERVQRPPALQVVEGDGRVDAPRQVVQACRHAQVGHLHARVEVRRTGADDRVDRCGTRAARSPSTM